MIADKLFRPTEYRVQLWERENGLIFRNALSSLSIDNVGVRQISDEFEPGNLISPDGVTGFSSESNIPLTDPTLDPNDYLDAITSEMSTSYRDVVRWMQLAAADYAVLKCREIEYRRAGSGMQTDSGDGAVGNVAVADVRFRADIGTEVARRGYAIAQTPRGIFQVPVEDRGVGVFRDLLAAGTTPRTGGYQYRGNAIQWTSLAETPIRESVGFFSDYKGAVAPNFFEQVPGRPKLSVTIRQRFQSDEDQTIGIELRDPSNYTNVVSSRSVDVASGESEVTYQMSGFPYVPTTVAQLTPENGTETSLELYTVS